MTSENVFDVIVIGAGPVGRTAAARAVRAGLTAAVVERRLVGGECGYYGCIPSKALLWPMELAAAVSRMPGVELAGPIDAAAVTARRDEFVGHYRDEPQVSRVEKLPATFMRGQGRLAGGRIVQVAAPDGAVKTVEARHAVVLATGSDPLIPDIPGLRDAKPWTNREATSVKEVPRRLVVIGGGPVGCEMAQSFEESGISVRLGRLTTRVERASAGGPVQVYLDDGSHLEADELLVAAGRRANVNDLGLETVGVDADGPLDVDVTMRVKAVSDGWLYAVGDVNGRNLLSLRGSNLRKSRLRADSCSVWGICSSRLSRLNAPSIDARRGSVPRISFSVFVSILRWLAVMAMTLWLLSSLGFKQMLVTVEPLFVRPNGSEAAGQLGTAAGPQPLHRLPRERVAGGGPDGPALRGQRVPQPARAVPAQVKLAVAVHAVHRSDRRSARSHVSFMPPPVLS